MASRDGMTRRRFLLEAAALSGAALSGCAGTPGGKHTGDESSAARPQRPSPVPRRVLGSTGVEVPVLGMGTAAAGKHASFEETVALFHEAIDLGVDYMDTAPDFAGYGHAQRALGEVLRTRRREVFLVTKCWEPTADGARRLLERNLKELQTDHADLVYAHSVGDDKMVPETVMGRGGVLEFLAKAKDEGLIRFAGISGHNRPHRFVEILRRFPIDVVMCAVNFADRHTYDFEGRVFPEARKRGAAIVAMKIFAGERGGRADALLPPRYHELAFRYAFGIPGLSLAVIGMKNREELRENIERVRRYRPLSEAERAELDRLGAAIASEWGPHFGPVT